MKLAKIGRHAVGQVRRYINWVKSQTDEQVTGVIVREGVMPAFHDELARIRDVKILRYGWELGIVPWRKEDGSIRKKAS